MKIKKLFFSSVSFFDKIYKKWLKLEKMQHDKEKVKKYKGVCMQPKKY